MVAEIFNFYIFRSSSLRERLPFEVVFILYLCTLWFDPITLGLKFEYHPTCGCWDIQFLYFEVVFPLRSSSIWGCLHFIPLYTLVWSYYLRFEIWVPPDLWLLRYSIFIFWGRLPFEVIFHLRLSSFYTFEHSGFILLS